MLPNEQPPPEPPAGVPAPRRVVVAESDEPSLGDLFRDLLDDTRTLVRKEVALAKAEASRSVSKAGRNVGFAAAGSFVAYAGFILVMIAVGLLLGDALDNVWLGVLITGIVVLVVGYAVLQKGINGLKNTDFSLEHTADSLREDTSWIQHEAQEIKDDPAHLGAGQ